MAAEYLLQEDGASRLTLEDGSGFILLESSTEGAPTLRPMKTMMWHRTRIWPWIVFVCQTISQTIR